MVSRLQTLPFPVPLDEVAQKKSEEYNCSVSIAVQHQGRRSLGTKFHAESF